MTQTYSTSSYSQSIMTQYSTSSYSQLIMTQS